MGCNKLSSYCDYLTKTYFEHDDVAENISTVIFYTIKHILRFLMNNMIELWIMITMVLISKKMVVMIMRRVMSCDCIFNQKRSQQRGIFKMQLQNIFLSAKVSPDMEGLVTVPRLADELHLKMKIRYN